MPRRVVPTHVRRLRLTKTGARFAERPDVADEDRCVAAYLLGVDVGTQSSKGALVTFDGRVVAHCAIEHDVSRPFPGWAEHDADAVWWGDVTMAVQSLLRQAAIEPA